MPGDDPDAATDVLRVIRETTGVDFDARGFITLLRLVRHHGCTVTGARGLSF
jgi:hypothetical protein